MRFIFDHDLNDAPCWSRFAENGFIKSKYSEDYSTVDKKGHVKNL